jgi:hypothetical protein
MANPRHPRLGFLALPITRDVGDLGDSGDTFMFLSLP